MRNRKGEKFKTGGSIMAARRPSPHGVRVLAQARSPYIPAWWAFWGTHADECQGRVPLHPRRFWPLTQARQGTWTRLIPPNVWAIASHSRAVPVLGWGKDGERFHLSRSILVCPAQPSLPCQSRFSLASRFTMERGRGIEPPLPAWKAGVLAVIRPSHMEPAAGLEPVAF